MSATHKTFMRIAIQEAKKGLGKVEPNPLVGSVIVKDKKVIAKGYHKRFGGPHAEVMALKKAKYAAKDATLYVTLEPCSHFGKTPPCTDLITSSGIKEVVAAMADPNLVNNGRGFAILRRNGIKVINGILRKEAVQLNRQFIERMRQKRPFITLKLAQSLDGKIATKTGDSKWISCEESRKAVQGLRRKHDAVMVGVNTVIRDDPLLTVRKFASSQVRKFLSSQVRRLYRQPIKIVVDTNLRTPPSAKIFSRLSPAKVIIATTKNSSKTKETLLRNKGAEILRIKSSSGRVDIKVLMQQLVEKGINSILVEGGGKLAASLFEKKLIDKLYFFIAPIIIGGRDAITSIEGDGIEKIKDALRIKVVKIKNIGGDLLIEGIPDYVHRNN